MRAVQGNKEYTIDESQQKGYQDMGFDILGDDGNVVAYGRGKTVPYDEYVKAVKEIGRFQKLVAEKENELEALKAELAELKPVKPDKRVENKKAETGKAGE